MKGLFLSLKWQVAIIVSLVLLIGLSLVGYIAKENLEQTYQAQRVEVYADRQQVLTASLEALQRQMVKLANHLQGMASREAADGNFTRDQFRTVLEQNWPDLNFEWGIDSFNLFDPDGQRIAASDGVTPPALVSGKRMAEVARSETPNTQIVCQLSCWQIVAVPVLIGSHDTGALVFSQDLAEVVLQFQSNTKADVGILLSHSLGDSIGAGEIAEEDGYHIVALTGGALSAEILRAYTQRQSFDALLSGPQQQARQEEVYELSLLQMEEFANIKGATMVVIENVTAEVERISSAVTRLFSSVILVFLLAEAALLSLLVAPMARLKTIANLLPRLANVKDSQAISQLNLGVKPTWFNNEIHDLFGSARTLSSTLGELDEEVKARTQALEEKHVELLTERNFITSLVNNIPAVILIQNPSGDIVRLNTEGERVLERSVPTSGMGNFHDFICGNELQPIREGLDDIFQGRVRSFNHESELNGSEQRPRYFEWRHSRLPDTSEEAPLVLSVGLDLTARKEAESNLAWLADHDPLTELLNRRGFQAEFEKVLKKSARNGSSGALIFCDLDAFKEINDTSGHPTGDRLLREIAARFSGSLRDVDVLARLGGDEFGILVEDVDQEGAIELAENISEVFRDMEVIADHAQHRISLSMGMVLYPEHGTTADVLMAKADLSMYRAKSEDNARTNWSLYTPGAPENLWLHQLVDWKTRIQRALHDDLFIFHYQPIYDIADHSVSHYEALIRLVEVEGKLIAPGQFIPVAERTGLIYDIDRYVLDLAAKVLRQFSEQGSSITLSVNLSAAAISNADFLPSVERLIDEHGIDPSLLIFELTETYAVKDLASTSEVIRQCRRLGYRFSLDDFGVGYASWFYLRQLPVDYVKIDGSFVRELATSREDRLFVSAINNIVHGLGKKTIAEYVEDREVLDILSQIGVDYAQGYHIGKPDPQLLTSEQVARLKTPAAGSEPHQPPS